MIFYLVRKKCENLRINFLPKISSDV